jgi:[acyl-carrier-protein] S-malonyltransferase
MRRTMLTPTPPVCPLSNCVNKQDNAMATRIVCVFPGQGSQAVGMGKDLWEADAAVKALYQEANDVLGYDLQRLCFAGPEDALRLTEHAQPAILVHSIATWTLLSRHRLQPVLLAGHSLGEYSALVASGVLRFADAVHLVHKRGVFMQEAVPPGAGSMAALLGVARQDVEALCAELGGDGVLQPANYNDPGQIVIAGETARVQAVVDAVKVRRLGKPVLLKVSAPFHCRMLQPAAERLAHAFAQVIFHPFTIPVLSNVTAAPHVAPATVQDLLVQQVCAPVRWEEAMRYAVNHGCDALLEVGPGKTLSGMMKRIAPQIEILALETFLRQ